MSGRQLLVLRHRLAVAIGLVVLAGIVRFWIAPQLEALPADYASETTYDSWNRFRETPTGSWSEARLVANRVDRTVSRSRCASLVQGDMHWSTGSGEVLYQTSGVYGVDCRTRANLAGYGQVERHGQFLFPTHVGRTRYVLWDPFYSGPRTVTFEHEEMLDGLPVYVFFSRVRQLDDTAGYMHLPGVPTRYLAYSEGDGTLWVEPTSGIVVDLEDRGTSYFGDPKTKARIADFIEWRSRYTPETRAAQVRLAASARRRIQALETGLPGLLVLAGLVSAALGLPKPLRAWRRGPRPAAAPVPGRRTTS